MVDCTDQQLATFLERALVLQIFPSSEDPTAPTDTGLTTEEFYRLYEEGLNESALNYTHVSTTAYDAVWALAIALDRTATMVNDSADLVVNKTGCEKAVNAMDPLLVPLENFTYANSFMGCVIQWNLARTNFLGVSGQVKFDATGSRVQISVTVQQYRNKDGNLERVKFAVIDSVNDSRLIYFGNESNLTVYPNGIPPDGTPINVTVTYHLALVLTYDIIAFVGLVFTTVCLLFNTLFRETKIIRLTSPNLNYFLLLGCYIIFTSIFFGPLPTTDPVAVKAQCHLQNWLSIVGYTLAFATILLKMVRVFHIFHNPTVKKQNLKDWHLVVIILSMTSFSVLLLIIGSAVPTLRPTAVQAKHDENPSGTNELGVRIDYFVRQCDSSTGFLWQIGTLAYLALLQLVGFILAIQTRKVKIKALNDSKYVAAIIYVTSIVLIMLIVARFALYRYLNASEAVFSGALMVGAAAFLSFIFIPKMVSLYQDPRGENIFGNNPTSTVEVSKSGALELKNKTTEGKIQRLEDKVKELKIQLLTSNGLRPPNALSPCGADKNNKPCVRSAYEVQFEFPDPQSCTPDTLQLNGGRIHNDI